MAKRNRLEVPEARKALENLKLEVAEEVGLHNYNTMDKGNLTSRDNGKVGGNMVRHMIEAYENSVSNGSMK